MYKIEKKKVEDYKVLHKNCPKEIKKLLKKININNFSIFLKEPENILFSYWEYVGTDFEKDMKIMSEDVNNKQWWELCGPCQTPFKIRKKGEWWSSMESIFYNE